METRVCVRNGNTFRENHRVKNHLGAHRDPISAHYAAVGKEIERSSERNFLEPPLCVAEDGDGSWRCAREKPTKTEIVGKGGKGGGRGSAGKGRRVVKTRASCVAKGVLAR